MNSLIGSLLFTISLFAVPSSVSAADEKLALAGWYDLVPPTGQHLHPMYDKPSVKTAKNGAPSYSQVVHFDAMTGLPRSFRVTIARDPDFKTRFSKDDLEKAPTTSLDIGNRKAWVWTDKRKVVISVGDDKAVVIETDPGSQPMPLVEYAKLLDYDRIEKALNHPPRVDVTLTVEMFQVLKKNETILGLYHWTGPAKTREDVGPKKDERVRWTYELKDGSLVFATLAAGNLESVIHQSVDGKRVELLK